MVQEEQPRCPECCLVTYDTDRNGACYVNNFGRGEDVDHHEACARIRELEAENAELREAKEELDWLTSGELDEDTVLRRCNVWQ